jgi:two-component SAPR family response regulator
LSAPLNYILLEEGYYRLCSEVGVITDVDEFDAHYEEGRRLQREGRAEEAAAEYERAIDLYRGEYLVEDLYEDWTMVERERLANAYMEMLGRLAEHYIEADQPQEGIRACYRILEKDRCHEESYRLLMRCYACLGLWERALRQYRLCERVLSQEYGMDPSPETHALYGSLLSKHP